MPPFRAGLLKRKIGASGENKQTGTTISTQVRKEHLTKQLEFIKCLHSILNFQAVRRSDEEEELIKGDIDDQDDATDSEHEPGDSSDEDQDVS